MMTVMLWLCRGMILSAFICAITNHGDYVVSSLLIGYLISVIGSSIEKSKARKNEKNTSNDVSGTIEKDTTPIQ